MVGEVRVPVEPGHELGGGVAARKVFPGDAETPVRRGARGEDGLVIQPCEVVTAEVRAVLDVAVETKTRVLGQLVVDGGDVLDLRMVRSDSVPYQAERSGQAIEHVDFDVGRIVAKQRLNRIETRGSRTNHRDSQGPFLRSGSGHETLLRRGTPGGPCLRRTGARASAHYSESSRPHRKLDQGVPSRPRQRRQPRQPVDNKGALRHSPWRYARTSFTFPPSTG